MAAFFYIPVTFAALFVAGAIADFLNLFLW